MITKRNKTVIAPTYIIRYDIPMKPTPNNIKNPAALQKTAIKKITAITGFTETITNTLENIVPQANKSINKFFMVVYFYIVLLHQGIQQPPMTKSLIT